MQLQQIEIFVRIYRTKSFARTAERMYMSQPRVSQQLKSMENEMGVTLFERTNHKVIPTEAGNTFFTYAVNILSFYNEGLSVLSETKNDFYIHTANSSYNSPIYQALNDLAKRCPEASFKIVPPVGMGTYEDLSMLIQNHLYMVRDTWIINRKMNYFDLGKAAFCCMLNPEDELCKNEVITPRMIKDRVVYTASQFGNRENMTGPFLWHLKNFLLEKHPELEMRTTQNLAMLTSKVLGSKKNVALFSNVQFKNGELPVELRKFESGDTSHIGFAYVGEASDSMKKYMEFAKYRFENQWDNLNK